MPLYEYRCTACNQDFDELVPASRRDDDRACPTCGAPARRKMSVFATSGTSKPSGGSSCSSCHSGSCGSCHH